MGVAKNNTQVSIGFRTEVWDHIKAIADRCGVSPTLVVQRMVDRQLGRSKWEDIDRILDEISTT